MKPSYLILLYFLYFQDLTSQVTFNLRDRYDFEACTLTGIVATDSCYYATGIIADTIFPYKTGAIFLKLGLDGTPLLIKTLKSTQKTYETWYNGLTLLEDGSLAAVGHTIDTTLKTILIKYDAEGDTIFTKEYLNPFYPGSVFIKPWGGMHILPDGGYIISCNITNPTADTDFYLIRTDSLGNKIWGEVYASTKWERTESIRVTADGKIVVGGIRDNTNTNAENYEFRCHLFQVDTAGNQDWAWSSSLSLGLRDAANDMLLLDDGSIIVASGVGYEQIHPSVNEVYFERHVFKLNPQQQIEWELTFPDSALTSWAKTTKLVELSDGSGYVLAGMTYNTQPPPKYFTIRGWLAKISPDGDSIWTRRYAFLTDGENEHEIYDMKETPDGGLIVCGKAFDWGNDALYPQQAWLLKLDQYGCLMPGCQLSDATNEGAQPKIQLAIYPNPTSDYLNFYLHSPNPVGEAMFRIVNGEGKLVKEFKSGTFNTTFILPVWDWASGVYWLQYMEDGTVRATNKFIVSRR
jgi:hypothetical protein